jgi:hypothetical protein
MCASHRFRQFFPLILLSVSALPAFAQGKPGPLPQSPPSGPITLPGPRKTPDAPPVPPDEIIRRFSANEDAMLHARSGYSFRKTIRVQELDDKGQVTGEFQIIADDAPGPDGKPYETVVKHPPSTMMVMNMVGEDADVLNRMPLFPLTTSQTPKYDIKYIGMQKLDELTTYIFEVKPKQVERTRALFDGVVWVDSADFAIVKTTGKWITELGEVSSPQFPFTTFDSLRENVSPKQWFPSYIRSDASVPLKNSNLHVRLTVLWQEYKPATSAPANPAGASPDHRP